jgi:hypothetical protein
VQKQKSVTYVPASASMSFTVACRSGLVEEPPVTRSVLRSRTQRNFGSMAAEIKQRFRLL